jgi:hypothetical protein
MIPLSRRECPIHNCSLHGCSTTHYDRRFIPAGNPGKPRWKSVITHSINMVCDECFRIPFYKGDTYCGFTFVGDYGSDDKPGIIAKEGVSIREANLSVGIDYQSDGIFIRFYNIDDHQEFVHTLFTTFDVSEINKSFRLDSKISYQDPNVPQIFNLQEVSRILRLSIFGETEDVINLLKKCF